VIWWNAFKSSAAYANQNLWFPESCSDSQAKQLDKMLADLMSRCGSNTDLLLHVLDLILPAFNPLRVVEENFDIIKNILVESANKTLSSIQSATRICIAALNSHQLESLPSFQGRLRNCAKRLLDCFISETQNRWSTFGSIELGKEQFTQKMALDPSRIPRLEYVVFSFGMAQPLLFYELLNDMALDINTRLQAFMLLKSFLILEVIYTSFVN
jgi:DNA mismatch repair ATPase MutS